MLDSLMVKLSQFGIVMWILIGAGLLLSKKKREAGMYTLASITLAWLVQYLLKIWIARPRPTVDPLQLLIEMPTSYSFPSGHAMVAFSAAATIWTFMPKWGAGALLLALLIAVSRVYLHVHFVSDVVFGAFIGIGISLALSTYRNRKKRRL